MANDLVKYAPSRNARIVLIGGGTLVFLLAHGFIALLGAVAAAYGVWKSL